MDSPICQIRGPLVDSISATPIGNFYYRLLKAIKVPIPSGDIVKIMKFVRFELYGLGRAPDLRLEFF